jgi:hypothetical protein
MMTTTESHGAWLRGARRAAILAACVVLAACNTGDEDVDLPAAVAGTTPNAGFTPAAGADCPIADQISMQLGRLVGSGVELEIVLTDCDGSLSVSGLAFEIDFDPAVANFVGCTAGSFFPSNQLLAGTPACTLSGGNVLGTITLRPPGFVKVGGSGRVTVVRVTFNLTQGGAASPVTFVGTDSSSGTALFFLDPSTQATTTHVLGAGAYQGGTFTSN